MKLFGKDLTREVAVIAEIGVNHEGDVETALTLVRLAAEAGADAVKFQSYTPERFIAADDQERLARVTRFALDKEAHLLLAAEARTRGIHFLSTPVSEDWLPFLADIGGAIKIASGDLTFEPLVRAAARTGLPVILSTGLGTVEEIDSAVAWARDEIGEADLADRLVLMHCVSAYPTPIEQANVRSVPFLAERYGIHAGYSNHVVGMEPCLAAISLGARVIEVHFTDRKEGRTFRDHALSMEPADLSLLVATAPRLAASLGVFGKNRQPVEAENVAATRKGIVAARDLQAGSILGREDLMWARPASEFAASEIHDLVGRRLAADLKRGQTVRRDAIAD